MHYLYFYFLFFILFWAHADLTKRGSGLEDRVLKSLVFNNNNNNNKLLEQQNTIGKTENLDCWNRWRLEEFSIFFSSLRRRSAKQGIVPNAQQKDFSFFLFLFLFLLPQRTTRIKWCQLPHCHMALCIKRKTVLTCRCDVTYWRFNDATKLLQLYLKLIYWNVSFCAKLFNLFWRNNKKRLHESQEIK